MMEKYYADIIAGIALEEAGISHILNAEGEKIQLAVSKCCNVSELLEVNASVACTVEELMWLEFISYHKIKAIAGCCGCQIDCEKQSPPKKPCKKRASGKETQPINTNDCIPIKENLNCHAVQICGRVFKENGEPCTCGVVTANGDCVVSTDICHDGRYILKNLHPSNKLVINAHSECGKTGSFLLKKPFKDSYQIDMFLNG